jgi:hypothetical protein
VAGSFGNPLLLRGLGTEQERGACVLEGHARGFFSSRLGVWPSRLFFFYFFFIAAMHIYIFIN